MRTDLEATPLVGDKLEALVKIPDTAAKFDFFADHLASFGFTDVFFARAGLGEGDPIVLRRWNPEWAELYDAKRFQVWDDAMRIGRTADRPFSLRVPRTITSKPQAEFHKAAEAYNRFNGFAVPYQSGARPVSGFSATGFDRTPPEAIVFAMAAFGYVFNLSLTSHVISQTCQRLKITPRQMMFLRMLSDGYTHVEIAKVLGLTEDWVHKSFARLREKFDARTDVVLIRKALEMRLLP